MVLFPRYQLKRTKKLSGYLCKFCFLSGSQKDDHYLVKGRLQGVFSTLGLNSSLLTGLKYQPWLQYNVLLNQMGDYMATFSTQSWVQPRGWNFKFVNLHKFVFKFSIRDSADAALFQACVTVYPLLNCSCSWECHYRTTRERDEICSVKMLIRDFKKRGREQRRRQLWKILFLV